MSLLAIPFFPPPLECTQVPPHATPPGIQFEWLRQGLPVCTVSGDQREPDINENLTVVWQDYRGGTESDIYAQSISRTGTLRWSSWPQGTPVCTAAGSQSSPVVASDYAGGAVIAWIDRRNGTSGDVYAQRLLSSGYVAPNRPTDGIAISVGGGPKVGARIAGDKEGGAYVAWMDGRNQAAGQDMAIYLQHMMQDGTIADYWAANGIRASASLSYQANVCIIPDAAGGAILAWEVRQQGAGSDIYAARFAPSGALAAGWPDSGSAVCAAPRDQINPAMAPDGAGGALIAWMDYRSGPEPKIYVQHLTASGDVALGWDPDGMAAAAAPGFQRDPVLVSDGDGGAIVAWWDYSSVPGSNLAIAQRVTSEGSIAAGWPAGGLVLGRGSDWKIYPRITSDLAGGAIVAWNDSSAADGFQVMAQHVSQSGVVVPGWAAEGVKLARTGDRKFATAVASDGAGGAIVAWMDRRNGTDWDVYAQAVTAGGIVGPDYCLRCGGVQTVSPNPGRAKFSIQVLYPRASSFIGVYDARGVLLRSVPLSGFPYAPTQVDVDISDLPNGVYFFGYPNQSGSVRFAKAVLVR